ncbi:MAG: hypothetical protein ACOCXJ_09080, partial [Planctomycetota bacterium]
CRYRYQRTDDGLHLLCTGTAATTQLRLLLPADWTPTGISCNGTAIAYDIETVESSRYATCTLTGVGPHRLHLHS